MKGFKYYFVLNFTLFSAFLFAASNTEINIVTFDRMTDDSIDPCHLTLYEQPKRQGESISLIGEKDFSRITLDEITTWESGSIKSVYIGEKAIASLYFSPNFEGKSFHLDHSANRQLTNITPQYNLAKIQSLQLKCRKNEIN